MHAQTSSRKTFLELRNIQFTEDRIITEAVNTVAVVVLRLYQIGYRDKVRAQDWLETRKPACSPLHGCIITVVALTVT